MPASQDKWARSVVKTPSRNTAHSVTLNDRAVSVLMQQTTLTGSNLTKPDKVSAKDMHTGFIHSQTVCLSIRDRPTCSCLADWKGRLERQTGKADWDGRLGRQTGKADWEGRLTLDVAAWQVCSVTAFYASFTVQKLGPSLAQMSLTGGGGGEGEGTIHSI